MYVYIYEHDTYAYMCHVCTCHLINLVLIAIVCIVHAGSGYLGSSCRAASSGEGGVSRYRG